jgi:hypothetical protein
LLGLVDGVLLDVSADLLYETTGGVVLIGYDLHAVLTGDDCSSKDSPTVPEQGGALALAFLAATGQVAAAVEIIQATDGHTTRFDDVPALVDEARARITRMQSARSS